MLQTILQMPRFLQSCFQINRQCDTQRRSVQLTQVPEEQCCRCNPAPRLGAKCHTDRQCSFRHGKRLFYLKKRSKRNKFHQSWDMNCYKFTGETSVASATWIFRLGRREVESPGPARNDCLVVRKSFKPRNLKQYFAH